MISRSDDPTWEPEHDLDDLCERYGITAADIAEAWDAEPVAPSIVVG